MKKINYNIITFISITFLIISGWFSKPLLFDIKNAVIGFIKTWNIEAFISDIESATKNISYKNTLIDIYSLYYRCTDTRVVEKADSTIHKLENDYLAISDERLTDDAFAKMADQTLKLKAAADELEIPFMYVMAPKKLYFDKGSETQYNYENFSGILKANRINVLDLAHNMEEQDLSLENSYFITDHHWTPETGFWAGKEIYQKLTTDYQMTLDEKVFDLTNYNIDVYEDIFLGSVGKKVGKYFTPLGLDDISLITPKFDTKLTVTDKRGTTEGSFQETLINMSELTSNDYYSANPYAAYSYGNSGLQIIENHLAPENSPEIIIIRDSFACTVTPYLSLTTDTLHVIDIRYWDDFKPNETITEYVQAVDPDCVLVLYSLIQPDMFEF